MPKLKVHKKLTHLAISVHFKILESQSSSSGLTCPTSFPEVPSSRVSSLKFCVINRASENCPQLMQHTGVIKCNLYYILNWLLPKLFIFPSNLLHYQVLKCISSMYVKLINALSDNAQCCCS